MATFLDIGVIGYFGVIFAFLLVFVILYGLLSWTKPFGEGKQGIYAIIAAAFAILSIINKAALFLISFMTPWFFIVIFFGFFIIFVLMMFGLKTEQLTAGASPYFRIWPIVIGLIILFFGLGGAFGQDLLSAGSGDNNGDNNGGTSIEDPAGQGSVPTNTGATGEPEGTGTGDYESNVLNTLVNPSVLGMILLLFIGAFAAFFLTKESLD